MTAPLYGLVLAGGRSKRMGRDKAAIAVGGSTQLERAVGLVSNLVARSNRLMGRLRSETATCWTSRAE